MKTIKLSKIEIDIIKNQLDLNACNVGCMCEEWKLYPRTDCNNCKYNIIIDGIIEKLGGE